MTFPPGLARRNHYGSVHWIRRPCRDHTSEMSDVCLLWLHGPRVFIREDTSTLTPNELDLRISRKALAASPAHRLSISTVSPRSSEFAQPLQRTRKQLATPADGVVRARSGWWAVSPLLLARSGAASGSMPAATAGSEMKLLVLYTRKRHR